MTKFERWLLVLIFRKLFRQGYDHHKNATWVYALIRQVWADEFTEDNALTTDSMLREAFEITQFRPQPAQPVAQPCKIMVIDNAHPNGIDYDDWVKPVAPPLTDEDCTRIYNEANNITVKNPPISTSRIFAAMRAAHIHGSTT